MGLFAEDDGHRALLVPLITAYPGRLVLAVPDPHVEVWYLSDPTALPRVLGEDFTAEAPPYKWERHRYKEALRQACRRAGVEPVAGGVEYGEDVAKAMDLDVACRREEGLGRFRDDLRGAIRAAAGGAR